VNRVFVAWAARDHADVTSPERPAGHILRFVEVAICNKGASKS